MVAVAPPAKIESRKRKPKGRWSWAWVVFSSVAIAAYFSGQYAQGTLDELSRNEAGLASAYADQPIVVQLTFYVHVVSAGLALALGPWQFSERLRARRWALHRWLGRVYFVSVAFASLSGLIMSPFNSVGMAGFFGFSALAVLWGWTGWKAYRAIRERDIRSHQAWVIRNFALTYAAVTLRLWFGVLTLVQVPFMDSGDSVESIMDNAYLPLSFLCWLPNLVVAEFMIRRRGLPALYITTKPASAVPTSPSTAEL
ncbi:DUF2306 domain-containing protein [Streptomyces chartreusis]|uniref:DUF2306 domain-containing protein n=1 Tax=Streptomyces chartreusis TaxID=1969 RepID=UPI002F917970|nr:DUF2306 domain-containing protein [Streptomyces chartreusis]WTA33342.1 DUF2306 domain-containing protein [Streptomyces chartreusis]